MKSFKELLNDVNNACEGEEVETEGLNDSTVSRAGSILVADVIMDSYSKVKTEKNINRKIDRLADLLLTTSAQTYHTLKR